ncbi:MAG: hypothetical protein M1830_002640, partial [Pleopsidium flavum]
MFTQPATSPPSLPTATSAASPTTPSRTGRLRGLSYLRSYTHNHLTSHSFQHSNTTPQRNSLLRSTSHPTQSSSERSYTNGPAADLPELQVQPPSITGEASSDQSEGSSTSGWLPTVGGLSGLSRVATQPQPTSAAAPSVRANSSTSSSAGNVKKAIKMARHRRSESNPQGSRSGSLFPTPLFSAEAMNFGRLQGTAEVETQEKANDGEIPLSSTSLQAPLPTVRFLPHHDPRSARPSLAFPPISRTLPDSSSIIKVGRYSERDSNPTPAPNTPSAAPVGFKSKVVSRKHCEFWCSNGQWYVKDVKSSSGTFLNHIRLSQPNVESRPFPVNDGDVVQLGIDFRGGEEMIFRCVKIRVECNRAWQKGLNNF